MSAVSELGGEMSETEASRGNVYTHTGLSGFWKAPGGPRQMVYKKTIFIIATVRGVYPYLSMAQLSHGHFLGGGYFFQLKS